MADQNNILDQLLKNYTDLIKGVDALGLDSPLI